MLPTQYKEMEKVRLESLALSTINTIFRIEGDLVACGSTGKNLLWVWL